MKRIAQTALVALLMVALAGPSMAEDKKEKKGAKGKKGANAAAALRIPGKIELTDDQEKKVAEIRKGLAEDAKKAREQMAAVMTKDLMKKRQEAMKAAKEAGKKGKEAQEAIKAALNLSDEQQKQMDAAQKSMREVQMKFLAQVKEILTDDQKAKLPKRGGKATAKPKKKKKDA